MVNHTQSLTLKLFGVSIASFILGLIANSTSLIILLIGSLGIVYLTAWAITSEVERMVYGS